MLFGKYFPFSKSTGTPPKKMNEDQTTPAITCYCGHTLKPYGTYCPKCKHIDALTMEFGKYAPTCIEYCSGGSHTYLCTQCNEPMKKSAVNIMKQTRCPACTGHTKTIATHQCDLDRRFGDTAPKCLKYDAGQGAKNTYLCCCGTEFTRSNCLSSTGKCRRCPSDNHTDSNYRARLQEKHEGRITCLEPVTHMSRRKYRHRCQRGHEWPAEPNQILRARGAACPECTKHRPITPDEYEARVAKLHKNNIQVLEPFVKSSVPIKHKCTVTVCRHEWPARPNAIMSAGSGCPRCAGRAGNLAEIPAAFYVLQCTDTHNPTVKIGITTKRLKDRYRSKELREKLKILYVRRFPKGTDAKIMEDHYKAQLVGRECRDYPNYFTTTSGQQYHGETEMFYADAHGLSGLPSIAPPEY